MFNEGKQKITPEIIAAQTEAIKQQRGADLDAYQMKVEQLKAEIAQLEQQIQDLTGTYQTKEAQLKQALADGIRPQEEKLARAIEQINSFTNDVRDLMDQHRKLNVEINETKAALEVAENTLYEKEEEYNRKIGDLQRGVDLLQDQKILREHELDLLQTAIEPLQKKVADLNSEIEAKGKDLDLLRYSILAEKDILAGLKTQGEEVKKISLEQVAEARRLIEEVKIAQEARAQFEADVAETAQELAKAKDLIIANQKHKNELDVLGKALNNKEAELKRREATIAQAEKKVAEANP